jgi:glycosyltransferase involved in cell wall biosynthesis
MNEVTSAMIVPLPISGLEDGTLAKPMLQLHGKRSKTLRIAWLSDVGPSGGVPGMATQLVTGLSEQDCQLHLFSRISPEHLEKLLSKRVLSKIQFSSSPYEWEWGRWYNRDRRMALFASFVKRIKAGEKLISELLAEHAKCPFDAVVQFSQIELFGLRKYAVRLPLVIFPCVHAKGELRSCIEEESIARRCEPSWWRILRKFYLELRSLIQSRDLPLARKVVGMSKIFNARLKNDYRLYHTNFGVVYHPIPMNQISACKRRADGQIRLLFAGRISVRKGIELLLRAAPQILSKHLDATITIVGGGSLWSSYEPLLDHALPSRLVWKKNLPHPEVLSEMESSDILLVPSHYEPGGIVVGEALAAGMLIVASDVVGSAEMLSNDVCLHFATGDLAAFLVAIETAIGRIRSGEPTLRLKAREQCDKHFSLSVVAAALIDELQRLP